MLDNFELVLELINAGIALLILYLGFRIISSMRLTLQRRSVNLFIAAAVLFASQEFMAVVMFNLPTLEFLEFLREMMETAFIGCLATAMYFVAKSERQEVAVLHRAADTDSLTKLYNMSYFRRVASWRIHEARSNKKPLSLLILDIDDFKPYNDRFGHEAGNLALQAVAHTLRDTSRSPDLVARYGGEEFAVLLDANCEAAGIAAERIRSAIELKCAPSNNPALSRLITVSIGVAELASDTDSLEDLIDVADKELYRAKKDGKNCVAVAAC